MHNLNNWRPGMRIAEVFFTLDIGGVERRIVDILNALPPRRFVKTLVLSHGAGMLARSLQSDIEVQQLGAEHKLLQLIQILGRTDLVHIHQINFNPFFLWGAAMAEVPVVLCSVEGTLSNPFAAYADFSTCEAAHLARMQPIPARLAIIPGGAGFAHPTSGDSREARDEKIILAELRRPGKELHASLIDLYPRLRRRFPAVECWVIGVAGASQDGLKFIGPTADPAPWLQKAHFLIHFSKHEVFSNALLEGMANGAIPIATAVGGNPEIITDGEDGFLCRENSVGALAAALENILQGYLAAPERFTAIRQAARRKIERSFSKPVMLQRYASLFRSLAGDSAPRRGLRLGHLIADGGLTSHASFLGLLESYCFQGPGALEALRTADLSRFTAPQQGFLLSIIGKEYFNAQKYLQAAHFLTQAASLQPQDFYAHIYLGLTLRKLGNLESAARAFANAACLVEDDIEARSNWLECLLSLKSLVTARKVAGSLLSLLPADAPVRGSLQLLMAQLRQEMGVAPVSDEGPPALPTPI